MSISRRYTSADLERLPDVEGTRYEIIDGELHVSKQPRWEHQYACNQAAYALETWNEQSDAGFVLSAPGLVFAEDQDVAPDVVWISRPRLAVALDAAGHLRSAPELVVEVLSPGAANERRDRDLKLALYSRQGAHEYWIVDWRSRTVQVFRREAGGLRPVERLGDGDVLTSPILPGFAFPIARMWAPPVRPA